MQVNSFIAYLVAQGLLSSIQADTVIEQAQHLKLSVIVYLISYKLLAYDVLAEQIAKYFGYPLLDCSNLSLERLPVAFLDRKIIEKYYLLPISCTDTQLMLATFDPTISEGLNEVRFHTNLSIKLTIAPYDRLLNLINQTLYLRQSEPQQDDARIITLVDQIITDAINRNASDIHLEPFANNYRVRFRVDGLLHEVVNLPVNLLNSMVARIKIMAELNIAEKRLPQDGKLSFNVSGKGDFDCRISTCPTLAGEKMVIRILNPTQHLLTINDLGLENAQLQLLQKIIKKPQGMILFTGPTGSGKTISLYAILKELNQITKNIVTIEEPVEIDLPGVNQVNVNPKIGLNFATALRTFLRQDPDIIMLGEIRDEESANIAVRAAQTGHLILSTLHTNTALESISRLLNMGIATFNLSNSLLLVIAQRLIRKLCPFCKKPQQLSPEILRENGLTSDLDDPEIYTASSCNRCNQGYQGRIGIFELLAISENINRLLLQRADLEKIYQEAQCEGLITLWQSGLHKVKLGMTSLMEIARVV